MTVSRVTAAPTWLLSRANARAQAILVAAFADFDIRPLHYRTLATLDEYGELSQAELGRHLAVDRKDITTTVDLLAERGWVERTADPGDRRRNIVVLTYAGRELLPRLHATLDTVQGAVLAPLTHRETGQLTHLLSKLASTNAETPHDSQQRQDAVRDHRG